MWKKKFKYKKSVSNSINNLLDDNKIAQCFADYFAKNSSNLLDQWSKDMESTFISRFNNYNVPSPVLNIEVEKVDSIINSLCKGKAAGSDSLTCEHLQFAHPIVTVCITKLFNLMLTANFVPDDFGLGIIIPIPKGESKTFNDKPEDFRGITISPIISKVFESCLNVFLESFLKTSDRQFGFLKNSGCSHAIYLIRKATDHFNQNSSTINLCSLYTSKAFDRVNHFALFIKLMERNTPKKLIAILQNWYLKLFSSVKWNETLSAWFKVVTGVRQGGILSPSLFSVFVDDVLKKLASSRKGCFHSSLCLNSFMYADDLILLSITLTDMQQLVNICIDEFKNLGLNVNRKKSNCLRIGQRHVVSVSPLAIDRESIAWVNELNYLGVKLLSP